MPSTYLLHLEPSFGHAKHYAGWTPNGVRARASKHRNGTGATLCRHAINAGCQLLVARTWTWATWQEARQHERRLKQQGKSRYCPICRAERKANAQSNPV